MRSCKKGGGSASIECSSSLWGRLERDVRSHDAEHRRSTVWVVVFALRVSWEIWCSRGMVEGRECSIGVPLSLHLDLILNTSRRMQEAVSRKGAPGAGRGPTQHRTVLHSWAL